MKIIYLFNLICIMLLSLNLEAATPAEAEYKTLKESWTLAEDGSQVYTCHKELTLFTHTAMNSTYGETFIKYNPDFQELKINESCTIQKDGSVVRTPENAFVPVLPKDAAGMPAYNHLIEMTVVHTGLELGATIVLDYTITSAPGYLPGIDVCRFLQHSSPIKEYTIEFNLPAAQEAHHGLIASSVRPELKENGDTRSLTWKFRRLPASSREAGLSARNSDIPVLFFSTAESNAACLENLYRQFDDSEAFKALAAGLTEGLDSDEAKIEALHNHVLSHIEGSRLSLTDAGYRIRNAATVLESAYGTRMEQNNLLCALLNASGFKACPAAAYDFSTDVDNLGMSAVSEWPVIAEKDGRTYRIDAMSRKYPAASCRFLVRMDNGVRIENPVAGREIRYHARITWKEEEPVAETSMSCPDWRYSMGQKEVSGKTENVQTEKAGSHILVYLPETGNGFGDLDYGWYNSSRDKELVLPALYKEDYSYEIDIPENMEYNSGKISRQISNRAGTLSITIEKKGGQVLVNRSLSITKEVITPVEYGDFRQLATEWCSTNLKILPFRLK